LTGALLEREEIDKFIDSILSSEEYKEFEDLKDNLS
jgi:hypothetical protein